MDFDDFMLCSKETLLPVLVLFIDLFTIDVWHVFT